MSKNRQRTVTPFLELPVHGEAGRKPCRVMTTVAIHTIEVDGKWFAAVVHHRPGDEFGCVSILDEADVEVQITLLRNAIQDADRLERGEAAIHATPSLRRN